MHTYRSHSCSALNKSNVGETVRLSGWVHRVRDHGGVLFIDLRDHYGITQVLCDPDSPVFADVEKVRSEWCIRIDGIVKARDASLVNAKIPTGEIEVFVRDIEVLGKAAELPLMVFGDQEYPEETRLRYRYLDLRRDVMQKNMTLRSDVVASMRRRMWDKGFREFQTPIITASSPEGARDFLVPSRLHPGKFYALPQAPQQFKQLIMVSGFDKYFQIAPCFRDEDARADRSPGEFYHLDIEMSVVEKLMINVFKTFSTKKLLYEKFPRITYNDAMLKYGTDKPDLRNPLEIYDLTDIFSREDVSFEIFKKLVKAGSKVRCIVTKQTKDKPRSFFDGIDKWAKEQGASGLAYFTFERDKEVTGKGPVGKFFKEEALKEIMKITSAEVGDSIFFTCGKINEVQKISALAREKIGKELNLIDENLFAFCWIVDYPMFEFNELTKKIEFSHNPFSMPQGDINNINFEKPLEIKAFQYDIVCNGIELSSGAIRNHIPDLMYKLFSIAGYVKKQVDDKFSGMINALSYGAPPHGGIAPGIDRIVMLLAGEINIREITLFPLNQNAQDLMMGAPSEVDDKQLKELSIKIDKKINS